MKTKKSQITRLDIRTRHDNIIFLVPIFSIINPTKGEIFIIFNIIKIVILI